MNGGQNWEMEDAREGEVVSSLIGNLLVVWK